MAENNYTPAINNLESLLVGAKNPAVVGRMEAVQSQLHVMNSKPNPVNKYAIRNGHTKSVLDNYEVSLK